MRITILPTSTFRLFRLSASAASLAVFALLGSGAALSYDGDDLFDSGILPPESRRAEGLAYLDLPMNLRLRFDATYSYEFLAREPMAKHFAAIVGPRIRNDDALDSRITFTQAISDRIEIGIEWELRSPLARLDLFDFESQTVGAMIRIVP